MTPKPLRKFSSWLIDHARGTLDDEITTAVAEVSQAVAALQRAGTVTIKLKVNTAGSGGRTVFVTGEVDAKPPKADPEASIYYTDDAGGLHREDPFQGALPGTRPDVDHDLPPLADPATGEIAD